MPAGNRQTRKFICYVQQFIEVVAITVPVNPGAWAGSLEENGEQEWKIILLLLSRLDFLVNMREESKLSSEMTPWIWPPKLRRDVGWAGPGPSGQGRFPV